MVFAMIKWGKVCKEPNKAPSMYSTNVQVFCTMWILNKHKIKVWTNFLWRKKRIRYSLGTFCPGYIFLNIKLSLVVTTFLQVKFMQKVNTENKKMKLLQIKQGGGPVNLSLRTIRHCIPGHPRPWTSEHSFKTTDLGYLSKLNFTISFIWVPRIFVSSTFFLLTI